MLELLTGTGLALSAGLNAYIPLLAVGLSSRLLDFVSLPPGWAWLENGWVQLILVVLLIVELVADKVPAVDSVNDWIQTVVRPASGGVVFGSGTSAETAAVSDPGEFFASGSWQPVVVGVLIALAVHLAKMLVRPVANALTAGVAAPVLSTAEDAGSILLSLAALLAPLLVIFGLGGLVAGFAVLVRRLRARRRERQKAGRLSTRPSVDTP